MNAARAMPKIYMLCRVHMAQLKADDSITKNFIGALGTTKATSAEFLDSLCVHRWRLPATQLCFVISMFRGQPGSRAAH